ncbi:MAG: hypothetical protein WCJ33_06690 [Pseudomonadota bacterium]
MIVSFYNDKVSKEVVEWQKKVFDKFGIELNQIKYGDMGGSTGHGTAIDDYLMNNEWDNIEIWDIDCIPLVPFYEDITLDGIYSIAQRASHIQGSTDYASPAFITFTMLDYITMGFPSFKPTERSDTGGEITFAAKANNINVHLLYPTDCEQPMWQLDNGQMFGLGTTYANKIYHAFNGRFNQDMFIKKCKQVCAG